MMPPEGEDPAVEKAAEPLTSSEEAAAAAEDVSESSSSALKKRNSVLASTKEKTKQGVQKSKEIAGKGVHGAAKGTQVTLRCMGLCVCNIPNKWPRSYTICTGIILPIFIIMAVSMGLGLALANYEMDGEISGNNDIMYARADLLKNLVLSRNQSEQELLRDDLLLETIESQGLDEKWEFDTVSTAVSSLSFNWIRCWNHTQVNLHRIVFPTDREVEFAHPDTQRDYFIDQYWETFSSIFHSELPSGIENATQEELEYAYGLAQAGATGEEGCEENFAGTAWFWFTIMTTVGYGNQAPTSREGRILIFTAGFVSILLFAVTLGFAGYILSSIIDDIVYRTHVEFISWPTVGCVIWGSCWMAWMLVIAGSADLFYSRRYGDPDFADGGDLYWFAYISTTTVGLGDYFLQPEVIFASDTMTFGVEFLVGFVFASTFFSKLGELITGLVPNLGTRLPDQLKATRLWHYAPSDFGIRTGRVRSPPLSSQQIARDERISALQKLVDDNEHSDNKASTNPSKGLNAQLQLLQAEEALLKQLLDTLNVKRLTVEQELEFEGDSYSEEQQDGSFSNNDMNINMAEEKADKADNADKPEELKTIQEESTPESASEEVAQKE